MLSRKWLSGFLLTILMLGCYLGCVEGTSTPVQEPPSSHTDELDDSVLPGEDPSIPTSVSCEVLNRKCAQFCLSGIPGNPNKATQCKSHDGTKSAITDISDGDCECECNDGTKFKINCNNALQR